MYIALPGLVGLASSACTSDCPIDEHSELSADAYNPCNQGTPNKLRFGCYEVNRQALNFLGGQGGIPAKQDSCPDLPAVFQFNNLDPSLKITVALDLEPTSGMITAFFPGGPSLGQGHIECNYGFLTSYPVTESQGMCSWTTTRLGSLHVASDDVVRLSIIESHDQPLGDCGSIPQHCIVAYDMSISKP